MRFNTVVIQLCSGRICAYSTPAARLTSRAISVLPSQDLLSDGIWLIIGFMTRAKEAAVLIVATVLKTWQIVRFKIIVVVISSFTMYALHLYSCRNSAALEAKLE
jgi:uncharacterized protein YacL